MTFLKCQDVKDLITHWTFVLSCVQIKPPNLKTCLGWTIWSFHSRRPKCDKCQLFRVAQPNLWLGCVCANNFWKPYLLIFKRILRKAIHCHSKKSNSTKELMMERNLPFYTPPYPQPHSLGCLIPSSFNFCFLGISSITLINTYTFSSCFPNLRHLAILRYSREYSHYLPPFPNNWELYYF